jgi:N6-adenosine-specific RNA methylase IME4
MCLHKYGVIYADPPWTFRNWSAKGTGRNAISHYDCLDLASLTTLPIADLAADDCALFLCATDPLLPRAFDLIRAWGLEYNTVGFYWVKLNAAAKHDADYFTGLGYWTRANPEQCLMATRGKQTRKAKNVRRLVVEKRREHSRKPDCVRERIERLDLHVRRNLVGIAGAIRWLCLIVDPSPRVGAKKQSAIVSCEISNRQCR